MSCKERLGLESVWNKVTRRAKRRAQYSKGGGEEGMGLEFRMSGFFDTRRLSQETLSADLLPLTKRAISVGSGA
jgi:hypothetical protein